MIKEENIGHVELAGKTEGQTCETSLDVYDGNCQTEEKYASYDLGDLKDAHINFDPEVVQIKAGKAEVSDLPKFKKKKKTFINFKFKEWNRYMPSCLLPADWQADISLHREETSWDQWK